MNSTFGRISRTLLFTLTATVICGSIASAQEDRDSKDKTRIGKLTDSLEVAIRTLNETMRKLNSEFASEFKHSIEASREASKRVMKASGSEYDSAMAELNVAMREMETELNSPNAASLRNSLHDMDSEMDLLKKNHPELHLDSMSFGPFHMPKVTMPEITIPEIDIPRMTIPKIIIPKRAESDWGGYIDSRGESLLSLNDDGIVNRDFILISPGDVINGNFNDPILSSSSLASPNSDPVVTKHYYSDGHTRYFINNSEVNEPIELNAPVEIWPKR